MNDQIRSIGTKLSARPRSLGAVAGALIGLLIGLWLVPNFGVASRGGGFGVWGWLFGTVIGAYVGFRIGEWCKRRIDRADRIA
jgi:hypothetical protein